MKFIVSGTSQKLVFSGTQKSTTKLAIGLLIRKIKKELTHEEVTYSKKSLWNHIPNISEFQYKFFWIPLKRRWRWYRSTLYPLSKFLPGSNRGFEFGQCKVVTRFRDTKIVQTV